MRLYRQYKPKDGDIIKVEIIKKEDIGCYVSMIEYANMEGFIPITEMVYRKEKSKKVRNVGQIFFAIVLDTLGSFITLSRTKVPKTDIYHHELRYTTACKFTSIGKCIYDHYCKYISDKSNDGVDDEKIHLHVMEETIWKVYDELDESIHINDNLYKDVLHYPTKLFKTTNLPKDFIDSFLNHINSKIQKSDIIMETSFNLSSYADDAIHEIQKVLTKNINLDNDEYKIKIQIVSSPLCKITLEGKNKHNMSQLLKDIYQQIKNNINPKHTIISIVNEEIVTKDVNIYLTSL